MGLDKKIFLVLLVEDNLADARLIQDLFSQSQMESNMPSLIVLECQPSLGSALSILEQKEFDAVFLDLSLPDSAGLNSFRILQTQFPKLPILILTGLDDETDALEAVREGAQDYLVKGRVDANGLTVAVRNAVEKKCLEEENKFIRNQLVHAQKMEAVGILAGGVAHDFNNLVTAIRGSADMAMFKLETSHPAARDLKNIQTTTERAVHLTRQLLLFSQKHHMEFELVNINDLIEALLKMLHRLLGEDIAVKTDLGCDLWSVRADRNSLDQVVLNLAVRAREAMLSGGILSIQTENTGVDEAYCARFVDARVGKFVRLTVSDNGTTLDPKTLENLFEPFFTGKSSMNASGFGLSVVRGIVKAHEGWMTIRSGEKAGSVFEIHLPAVMEIGRQPKEKKISFDVLKGKGEKILVVEDEEGIREFVRQSLGEMGYVVSTASQAMEAATIFRAENGGFDLAVIDVVLPDRGGIDLAADLLKSNPKLKVLLSSGYMDHRSQWPLIEEKGLPFLQKPYLLVELLKKLRDVLSR